MIYVTVERLSPSDSRIKAFVIKGHADFDVRGKDIVCSAVSAITVGTVNSVEALTGLIPVSEMQRGLLDVSMPHAADPEQDSKAQLLLESMVVMLQTIEDTYSDYITIETTYCKGG